MPRHRSCKGPFITGGAVEKHVKGIFGKLGLAQGEADHHRMLAELAYLHD